MYNFIRLYWANARHLKIFFFQTCSHFVTKRKKNERSKTHIYSWVFKNLRSSNNVVSLTQLFHLLHFLTRYFRLFRKWHEPWIEFSISNFSGFNTKTKRVWSYDKTWKKKDKRMMLCGFTGRNQESQRS